MTLDTANTLAAQLGVTLMVLLYLAGMTRLLYMANQVTQTLEDWPLIILHGVGALALLVLGAVAIWGVICMWSPVAKFPLEIMTL